MPDLRLTGYGPSVYTRAARIALHELGQDYEWAEADPFEPEGRAALTGLHPFARVPVLRHGGIVIYETRAILTYLEETFRPDRPRNPLTAARTAQVQGLIDAYGYWPLVRQVYSHGAFKPAHDEPHDPSEVTKGLEASGTVLDALEEIAREGAVLNGRDIGQADWHLAPMLGAFRQVASGSEALRQRPALSAWFEGMAARDSMRATEYRREETGA